VSFERGGGRACSASRASRTEGRSALHP
jgi:hypothetical protein